MPDWLIFIMGVVAGVVLLTATLFIIGLRAQIDRKKH